MTRVLIVTDAWKPQVNGVVHSLEAVAREAAKLGAEMAFCTPEGFRTFGLPGYSEIRLAPAFPRAVAARIDAADADHVHIATEGPLGLAARRVCVSRDMPFTTSYHTRFPEYLHARTRFPMRWTYAALRRFHNAGAGVMTSTTSLAAELRALGFRRTLLWSRGVDHDLFRPRPSTLDLPRPIFLYAGRVAIEKNLEAFLSLELPGSKVVVGDGPARPGLQAAFPAAHFLGMQKGEALARIYASSDVFVFPSRTDTFGIVLLEAMASGLPVAAFPVQGPLDVVTPETGVLSNDLRAACLAALDLAPEAARTQALRFTWANSARQFLDNLKIARAGWRSAEERELFGDRQVVEAR